MGALAVADHAFLREVYGDGLALLDDFSFEERRLHGEPHDGNRLLTAQGIYWIDFESCCLGPLEWDLAFQPPMAASHFPEADHTLLSVLRRLNSARVATWCWAQARYPVMRQHAEYHLAALRQQERPA